VTYAVEGNGDVDPKKNEDIQVLSTDEVTGSTATAEDGYKFDGWYKGDEQIADAETPELTADVAKAKLNKDGDGLNANTTYTAKFSVDESLTYKVTFESSDETMGTVDPKTTDEVQVLTTEGLVGSKAEVKNGYKFNGWSKKGELTVFSQDAQLTVDAYKDQLNKDKNKSSLYANTTFVANFEVDESQTYDVLYFSEDESMGTVDSEGDKDIQVLGIDGVKGAKASAITGYKLVGWYKVGEEGDELVTDAVELTPEIIEGKLNKANGIYQTTSFKAKFEIDDENTYDVLYIAEKGGKATPSDNLGIQVLTTEGVTGSTATVENGYEFAGWFKRTEEGDVKVSDDLKLTDDLAITNLNYVNEGSSTEVISSEDKPRAYKDTTYVAKFEAKIYNVTFEYRIVDGVEKPANWDALVAEIATHNMKVKYGDSFDCPELPTVEGYTFGLWSMEAVKPTTLTSMISAVWNAFVDVITGKLTIHAASQRLTLNTASDVVVYSIVTKNEEQIEPNPPTPNPPTPTPDDDDDDDDDDDNRRTTTRRNDEGDSTNDNSGNGNGTPNVLGARRNQPAGNGDNAAVLGARRGKGDGPAVLGARRGGTDDNTDASRVIVLLIAAGAVATLLVTGKKRRSNEE
ncbi:MAG: InlB B-repeat-containing protein, partial [Butyrivibrio sp.]|nr:InlB B-repeat-containing protein [Butyrivibrio sp.]